MLIDTSQNLGVSNRGVQCLNPIPHLRCLYIYIHTQKKKKIIDPCLGVLI